MEVNQELKNREQIIKILKIISFFPLVIYPFILLANLMSLFGHRSGNESLYLILTCYSFLIFSSLYPLTLIYSLKKNYRKRITIAVLPMIHLIISVMLCVAWLNAGE